MPTPLSTYRLQFRPEFGFDDAVRVLPYLKELGITHIYCSPYLQAAPGSTHGYDVVDPSRVNEELGGADAHGRFIAALADNGLGQILDIVPNHMAIPGRENAWWWDVLKLGPSSAYADFFDIDWSPPQDKLRNRVLMPVLGEHYGTVLQSGDLKVIRAGSELVVRYFDNEFPLDPTTVEGLDDSAVVDLNGNVESLDALLEKQHYRLAFWRVAGEELDYRRFFDINSLVALHAENPEVFVATHARIIEWLRDGVLDGVRIDHIDGLRDPAQYLYRLRKAAGDDKWIVAEKITEGSERLPATWPIAGTTGYDALNRIDGLFVEPDGESALTDIYNDFIGEERQWAELVAAGKRNAVKSLLVSDLDRLTKLFTAVCEGNWRYRDYTRSELRRALAEVLIAFPVYRSYVSAESQQVTDADRAVVDEAIRIAAASAPDLKADLLQLLRDILLLEIRGDNESELAMRFQQLSGPVMAKGVEDTAFYRYFRLSSRNEVGGDPSIFALRPDDFHEAAAETQRQWPDAMVSTTTHDTKRSEDARHRLNVLSEVPQLWSDAVSRWSKMNEHLRRSSDELGERFPDRNTEYLIYQTLVAAHPISIERLNDYVAKATKEAKTQTTWTEPNKAFDEAVEAFLQGLFSSDDFLQDVASFVRSIAGAGQQNALSAVAVKLTMPGVPDTYQGTELWDFSLVDPDNRRPVDYALRQSLLRSLQDIDLESVKARASEGLIKLFVTQRCLQLRRTRPDSFNGQSSYEVLRAVGEKAHHVVAFKRGSDVVTVVPRSTIALSDEWEDTVIELPAGRWQNIFTGQLVNSAVPLEVLLGEFPVAVLQRRSDSEQPSSDRGEQ